MLNGIRVIIIRTFSSVSILSDTFRQYFVKSPFCSLNKDEKKEFEQLGLLNDDES